MNLGKPKRVECKVEWWFDDEDEKGDTEYTVPLMKDENDFREAITNGGCAHLFADGMGISEKMTLVFYIKVNKKWREVERWNCDIDEDADDNDPLDFSV